MVSRWRHPLAGFALAVAGGCLWSLVLERDPAPWLAWLALVPLVLLLAFERHGALWGWLHGIVFWLVSIRWIAPTLVTFGGIPPALSWVLLCLLAAYLALQHAIFVGLGSKVFRRSVVWALVALPGLWVGLEWLRGVAFGGFPWNLAAYAWTEMPGALPFAAWGGAWGVSWAIVFTNLGLALAAHRRQLAPAALGVLLPLLGLALAGRFSRPEPGSPLAPEIAVLQPNASLEHQDGEDVRSNYRKVVGLAETACAEGPALLLWPESAAWPFIYGRSPELERDLDRLVDRGCEVIFNTVSLEGETMFNSALLVGGEGVEGRYDKRQLVPWGERVPLSDVFPFIGKLARQAGEFTAGERLGLMPWQGETIGMAICYEVIFPAAVAEQVQAGASVLATVTNDAWYGDTAAPWQHFRAARFRAAENRRPLVRAALTGVSAIVGPRGEVVAQLGVGEEGLLRRQVAGRREIPPFTRAPWLVPLAGVVLTGCAIVSSRRK